MAVVTAGLGQGRMVGGDGQGSKGDGASLGGGVGGT